MSKPQFAGEPNMEDILASIRKMISEEPAGPRPVPDQLGRTAFTASAPEAQRPANGPQQSDVEDNITRLLNERPGPTQGQGQNSRPLAAFSGGRDTQPAARVPGRASAFDKPASQANDATLPFGRRLAETGLNSLDRTVTTEPSVGPDEPLDAGTIGSKGDGRSALEAKDTGPAKPAPAKVSSLVANLEKARADTASQARGNKVEEPPATVPEAPAPEAVAAALLDKSGTRLTNADSRPPAANGATISPFGSGSAQSEVSRADSSMTGRSKEASADRTGAAAGSGNLGAAALRALRSSEANASARTGAKPGAGSPPSEALLDAVVDMVKKEPSSLSVFTSGSAFIHGVADGEKPGKEAAPPRKLDTAASELLRPMLRQWLSENMPRIVEEALRSELDSSQSAGEGTDKA